MFHAISLLMTQFVEFVEIDDSSVQNFSYLHLNIIICHLQPSLRDYNKRVTTIKQEFSIGPPNNTKVTFLNIVKLHLILLSHVE